MGYFHVANKSENSNPERPGVPGFKPAADRFWNEIQWGKTAGDIFVSVGNFWLMVFGEDEALKRLNCLGMRYSQRMCEVD